MLRHVLGGAVMFLSLQHFIYPCLSVMLCLSVCLFMFLPACAPDEGGRQEGQNLKDRQTNRALHSSRDNLQVKICQLKIFKQGIIVLQRNLLG